MASIITSSSCILCCIPQQGYCHEKTYFITQIDESNTLLENFDNFGNSKDPFEEGNQFLNSFLNQLNTRYGLNLTITEACQLVRENIHSLDMRPEIQEVVLNTIALYESNGSTNLQHQKLEYTTMAAARIYCPFNGHTYRNSGSSKSGYGKLSCLKILTHQDLDHLSPMVPKWNQNLFAWMKKQPPTQIQHGSTEIELPPDIYIGGVELLAGALCMIVGTVIPPFYAAGTLLLGDGVNRVCNGVSQLGEERRMDPNYPRSDFP